MAIVVAAEALHKAVASERELLRDVLLDNRRCGGGHRDHRRGAVHRQVLAEHAIVGPEVMPPLRNAVRFIDRNQCGLAFREHFRKSRDTQAFGRDEEKVEFAV